MVQGRRIRKPSRPRDTLPLEALRRRCECRRTDTAAVNRGSTVRSFCAVSTPKAIVRGTMASTPAPVGRSGISSSNHHSLKRRQALKAGGGCTRRGAWMARCASSLQSMLSGALSPPPRAEMLGEEQRYRLEWARRGTHPLRPGVHSQYTVDP